MIEKLNCALRWRGLFFCLSRTRAASQQGQQACRVFRFLCGESLDPNIQSSQPFLRRQCIQTLHGVIGVGSSLPSLLSVRRLSYLVEFPTSPNLLHWQPFSSTTYITNFFKRRSWDNRAIGSDSVRQSTCELWSPTTLTEAHILGRPR